MSSRAPRSSKKRKYVPSSLFPDQEIPKRSMSSVRSDGEAEAIGFTSRTNESLVHSCLRRCGVSDNHQTTGVEDTSLPTLDETFRYGIDRDQKRELLGLEVQRLLSVIDSDDAVLFQGNGILDSGDTTPFRNLSNITHQILCNLSVCTLDNEIIFLENCKPLFEPAQYQRCRAIINDRLNPANPQRHPRRLGRDNSLAHNAVVDYVTAMVAHLCIKSIGPERFHTLLVANLARLSMKLKVLAVDSVRNAEKSLDAAAETIRKAESIAHLQAHRLADVVPKTLEDWDEAQSARYEGIPKTFFQPEEDRDRKRYYLENCFVRSGTASIMWNILLNMEGTRNYCEEDVLALTDSFDSTCLVFSAGFSSHPTLLSQDRDGELGGSSHPHCLRVCFIAFGLLMKTSETIKSSVGIDASPHGPGRKWEFFWRWEDLKRQDKRSDRITSNDTDVAVSILVPYFCCSAEIAREVTQLLYLSSTIDPNDGVVEVNTNIKFEALATMKTETLDQSTDHDTSALAGSVLGRQKLFYTPRTQPKRQSHSMRMNTDLEAKELSNESARAQMQQLDQRIRSEWVIDHNAVIIRCDRHVYTILAACFLFVAGGIAVGFSVGDRVQGVDPFGITTFCWVLAGFLAVFAKSMFVETWSWRDFFLRRVVCRSVSELSAVTRIDPQHIIAYLLHNEDSTIINVKGPFNVPFNSFSEDGFAIDEKPTVRTLLLSGLVVVKVATSKAPALVSLNIRKGKEYVSLSHYHARNDKSHLTCQEMPLLEGKDSVQGGRDLVLTRQHLDWFRIYGIYNIIDSTIR